MQRVVTILNYMLAGLAGALAAWLAMRPEAEVREAVAAVEPVRAVVAATPVTAVESGERAKWEREKAELETQLNAARAELAAREGVFAKTKEALEELRRPMTEDILSSSLRAEMKSGEAIVTGGYRLPDGKRLYAFATPVLEQSADGGEQVRIEGRYLAVTDAAGTAAGLEGLTTNAANTLQHGEVWVADEQKTIMAQLEAAEGTDVLSYPAVSVRPGFSASIDVGGIRLKVTPERSDTGDGLNVELRLEQPAVTISPQEPVSPAGL
jgi:hypothetical protein